MTTDSITAVESGPEARVHAVRHRYARRSDRATAADWAYTTYLTVILALVYLVPVLYLVRTSPTLLPLESATAATPVACLVAAGTVWGAQLAGRFWGPLVLKPFLLHVFTSTDLPPLSYLGPIARRRLAYAGLGTLLTVSTATLLMTDLFDHSETALVAQGAAVAVGIGAIAAVTWLWGQVRTVRENITLAAAVAVVAVAVALLGQSALADGGGLWLTAGVLAVSAAVLGRSAFRSIHTVDLARLARESARAAEAQTFAWTGTLHHALDLYRPEPRGLTSALVHSDGRLRGHLAQGAVRALRTRGRAAAAAAFLLTGGALLTLGVAEPDASSATLFWVTGATAVYWGSGWVSETWRGLRDELALAPLFGEWWGGMLARTLAWPVVAVVTTVGLAGGIAAVIRFPLRGACPADAVLLTTASVALVLSARFLREMKTNLPIELLLPIITPLGDLSGVRVFVWQFDGLVVVLVGILVMAKMPSALGAALVSLGLTGWCVWTGLRRTGWARRALFTRLGRV
nr:SinP [Streptomyces sp.]